MDGVGREGDNVHHRLPDGIPERICAPRRLIGRITHSGFAAFHQANYSQDVGNEFIPTPRSD